MNFDLKAELTTYIIAMYMAVWCGVLFASVQLVEQSTARLPAVGSWEPVKSLHNDYVFTHYPSGSNKPELVSYVVNTTVVSTGRLYTMYVAVLLSSVLSSFSLELPPQGSYTLSLAVAT